MIQLWLKSMPTICAKIMWHKFFRSIRGELNEPEKKVIERKSYPNPTFKMYEEEWAALEGWMETHDAKCPLYKNAGCIGGRMTYSFTPTSIGTVIKVDCACGSKFDATDYGGW